MSVQNVMTTEVVTVSMDDSVDDARAIFDQGGFHHLVVEENGQIVGVLSDRDLLRSLSPFVGSMSERPQDINLLKRRIHQIMTRQLVCISPESSLAEAAMLMLDERVSCLPVVDGRMRCVGILTIRDMLRWSIRCMDADDIAEARDDAGEDASRAA